MDGTCTLNTRDPIGAGQKFFKEALHDKILTDVVLVTEDFDVVEAHLVILSSRSLFFKEFLKIKGPTKPFIFLDNITHSQLSLVLEFIYVGKCEVRQDEVYDILSVCKKLQIELIFDRIEEQESTPAENTIEDRKDKYNVNCEYMENFEEKYPSGQDEPNSPISSADKIHINPEQNIMEDFIKRESSYFEETPEKYTLVNIKEFKRMMKTMKKFPKNCNGYFKCDQCPLEIRSPSELEEHIMIQISM